MTITVLHGARQTRHSTTLTQTVSADTFSFCAFAFCFDGTLLTRKCRPSDDFWCSTYSGCPLTTTNPQTQLHTTPIVDLWEAIEDGDEGPAHARNNSCGLGRTFVPFNGCGDELGRRCAIEWTARPFDRAACVKCAIDANITACGQPFDSASAAAAELHPSAIIERWCQGFASYTTGAGCRGSHGQPAAFEDDMFAAYAADKVAAHPSPSVPLLLFFSVHAAHTPLQVPESTLQMFDGTVGQSTVPDKPEHTRQVYTAMVHQGDAAIGHVVEAFKARGLWSNTLVVYCSDNVRGIAPQSFCFRVSTEASLLCARGASLTRLCVLCRAGRRI
eukprot:SAG22_NODE_48_length_24654_cov_4.406394_24_plen_331_part_00